MNFETLMEIDLKKIKNNTKLLCKSYSDYKYKFANLKDFAHGMGFDIVNTLVNNGINYLIVGSFNDALMVRKRNSDINILVNYYVPIDNIYDAINNNFAITIYSLEQIKYIDELDLKDNLKLHLFIDNGANKLGISKQNELLEILDIINNNRYLDLEGIYTNLTTLGVEDEFYYEEVSKFLGLIKKIVSEKNIIIHLNEPIMYHKKIKYVNGISFDLSLIGIEENIDDSFISNMHINAIRRKYDDLEFPNINLELVFNITSEVMSIKRASKKSLIGKNYIAKEDMLVALIPVGHKDGITKAIKYVGINNYKRNIIADEIDYIIVEVDKYVKIKDKVYIVNEERDIYNFLTLLNTNRYYLMSVLNKGLRKVYINEDSDIKVL